MSRIARGFQRLSPIRWLVVSGVMLLLSGCGSDCVNTVKQEVKSPDGKYVATAFVRNCGATTDFSAQVDVHEAGSKSGKEGNVYRGYRSQDIQVAWLSASHLVITSGCLEVKYQVTNLNGIMIERHRGD